MPNSFQKDMFYWIALWKRCSLSLIRHGNIFMHFFSEIFFNWNKKCDYKANQKCFHLDDVSKFCKEKVCEVIIHWTGTYMCLFVSIFVLFHGWYLDMSQDQMSLFGNKIKEEIIWEWKTWYFNTFGIKFLWQCNIDMWLKGRYTM